MSSRYVLERRKDGTFTFTLQAHDGKILLTSRSYHDKDRALRTISMARQLARRDENYELLRTDSGPVYFVLKNARGEMIGQSRRPIAAESFRQEMNLVKAKTRGARLEDLTEKL